jgi:predicted RNase H-like nuclease (RuvC/YqgF family)
MRDAKAPLLLLLSTGLLGTWIYHLYDKSRYSDKRYDTVMVKDSSTIESRIRDSVHLLFSEALENMKMQKSGDDSLQGEINHKQRELNNKVSEILRLRNEINGILQNKMLKEADLEIAKQKIAQLQQGIDEIKMQNSTLEEERMRLNTTLEQLSVEMKTLTESVQKLTQENSKLTETINEASTFVASDLNLMPMNLKQGTREVETTVASKAKKFVVSFFVKNNVSRVNDSEVVIVIVDPDNNVMQSETWSSGSFPTKAEGHKKYTIKFLIEYQRGDNKRVQFSLNPDKFMKGNYKMQVYHNGVLIGETTKALS